jgi:hypothetical protein
VGAKCEVIMYGDTQLFKRSDGKRERISANRELVLNDRGIFT